MTPLLVTATAAVTPAGGSAEQTACSIRARLARRHEHVDALALAREGEAAEPVVVSSVRTIDAALKGHLRVVELLVAALEELTLNAGLEPRELTGAALLLALPSGDDVVATWPLEALAGDVSERTGIAFKVVRSSDSGHAAMVELLAEAARLLDVGEVDACVVAGADSFIDVERLSALDAAERVHTRRNVDGFCPAEGASALLVESARRVRARGAHACATIAALGRGKEPNPLRGSDRQSTGAGLTDAMRAAAVGGAPLWLLDDLNGERYRAFELGLVRVRLGALFEGFQRVEHTALATGDLGAATGGVLVATAIAAIRRGWSPGDALVVASADGPLRAAARISAPGERA
ncbi:MAG: beta-ketoacyl synthase N-terminal-like domain-containing protein [Polyangiaceae bacterium]